MESRTLTDSEKCVITGQNCGRATRQKSACLLRRWDRSPQTRCFQSHGIDGFDAHFPAGTPAPATHNGVDGPTHHIGPGPGSGCRRSRVTSQSRISSHQKVSLGQLCDPLGGVHGDMVDIGEVEVEVPAHLAEKVNSAPVQTSRTCPMNAERTDQPLAAIGVLPEPIVAIKSAGRVDIDNGFDRHARPSGLLGGGIGG